MVKVTKKEEAIKLPTFETFANTIATQNRNSANTKAFNALKEAADIEDNRAAIY